jgi:Ala-tRNA(Pro) deacylase
MQGSSLRRPAASPAIVGWLVDHQVGHSVHPHRRAESAFAAAHADRISIRRFVKVIAVETDAGITALLALDAGDRLDPRLAARALGAEHVRLLAEPEVARLAPLDEVGALAPIGQLYGLPLVADRALRRVPFIAFDAGSHEVAVHVDRLDWERAAGVTYRALAAERRWNDPRMEPAIEG